MNDFVLGSIGNDLLSLRYFAHLLREEIKDLSFVDPELVSKSEVINTVIDEALFIYEGVLEDHAHPLKNELNEHFKED